MHVGKVVERKVQFFYCVGDKFFRFRKVVQLVESFVTDPAEAIKLEVILLDLLKRETSPALRGLMTPRALSIRIWPVAFLELREVLRRERPALLRDLGDVRACVIDPDPLGRGALREEDDVGLGALACRD